MTGTIEIKVEVQGTYIQEIKPLDGFTKEYVLAQLTKGVLFSGLGFSEGGVGAELWDSEIDKYIAVVIDQDPADAEVTIINIEA